MHVERTVLHLQVARTLRSISQGIAVVDLTLYLKDLHWSAQAIGGVISAAGIFGAAMILLIGVLSDRIGRKPFLLIYECLIAVAALLVTFTANSIVLTAVIVIAGFGRGQNGAAGPFTPAEQAWMAALVPRASRGRVFSVNSALGFFGMALGSVIAGTTKWWSHALPGALSFRPLFFLMFLFSVACAVVISLTPKEERQHQPPAPAANQAQATVSETDAHAAERQIRQRENRNMLKLAAVNLLNGLAVGFFGPLISYWFAIKFGASTAQIGVTLAVSFVLTGFSSLITGELTRRFGMVKSVVFFQVLGVCMILILPLMPSFWLASVFYILRSALNRGTQGARSALSASLTRNQRRGFSVSMNSLVMRLTSALGPTLSGYILDIGELGLPFYLGGVLQLGSTLLYGRLFRDFDRSSQASNAKSG
ncbi:MFS transporter [Alicyclobacillus fodiniaquatilis]|uniref:MFS transporter n=1 Tax=Alicyclobacillus fodiniaquatilis TaxID=1661150 RepID=A0ABW4JDL6_9BACL